MRGQVLLMVGCLLLLQFPHTCISTESLARHRRGLLDMIVTLWCYREKLHVPLLGINLYGCYCGTGGSGSPVDAVDKCCFLHDCCYYHSRISMKCYSKVKWELYHFSCRESQTQCMSHNMCGRMACECDKQLAECLTQARPSNKHFFYNRKDLCPGPKDTCPASLPNGTEVFSRTQEPPHKPKMVTKPSQSRTGNRKQSLGTSWMKNIWKVQSPRGKANA